MLRRYAHRQRPFEKKECCAAGFFAFARAQGGSRLRGDERFRTGIGEKMRARGSSMNYATMIPPSKASLADHHSA